METAGWEQAALLLAVLAPLVGVPLTVFMFYLKGLRDQQRSRWADVCDRLLKDRFGPEHGLEYVRKKGVFTWKTRL